MDIENKLMDMGRGEERVRHVKKKKKRKKKKRRKKERNRTFEKSPDQSPFWTVGVGWPWKGLSQMMSHYPYTVRVLVNLMIILVLNWNPVTRPGVDRAEGALIMDQGLGFLLWHTGVWWVIVCCHVSRDLQKVHYIWTFKNRSFFFFFFLSYRVKVMGDGEEINDKKSGKRGGGKGLLHESENRWTVLACWVDGKKHGYRVPGGPKWPQAPRGVKGREREWFLRLMGKCFSLNPTRDSERKYPKL